MRALIVNAKEFFESSSLNSTSKTPRDNSDTLTPIGTIAFPKVLHQPLLSLAEVASAKKLH